MTEVELVRAWVEDPKDGCGREVDSEPFSSPGAAA